MLRRNDVKESTLLEHKNIIFWGQYHLYDLEKENLKNRGIEITHALFCEKNINKLDRVKILKSFKAFLKINDCCVILGHENLSIIKEWSDTLIENERDFTHLFLLTQHEFDFAIFTHMEIQKYTDSYGNVFINRNKKTGITILFRNRNIKGSYIEIGDLGGIKNDLKIDIVGNNSTIQIGDKTNFVGTYICINTDGIVKIGVDCMFSFGIGLQQSDQHHIFDLTTKKRINYPRPIIIGNHVWCGRHAQLLGGFEIGDGSIIGAESVSSGKFGKNLIIAGCPAKVLRENILWSRDGLDNSNRESLDECKDKNALKYLSWGHDKPSAHSSKTNKKKNIFKRFHNLVKKAFKILFKKGPIGLLKAIKNKFKKR